MPAKQSTKPKTVDVVFSLPAQIDADEVAICGEFNDWSNHTKLAHGSDGSWQTTITLSPGVYRYR